MSSPLSPDLPKENFDPRLRQAMAEILEIARKYDILAAVVLGSRNHAETRFRFPTWSVAQIEEREGRPFLRFKTKGRPPEDAADTLSLLDSIARTSLANAKSSMFILDKIRDAGWDFNTETREGPAAPPWDFR